MFFQNIGYAQVLDIPVIGQEQDKWCAVACVQAVLNYFNIYVSQCELKDFQKEREHWKPKWYTVNNCCSNSPHAACNDKYTDGWGSEGSVEEMLRNYGSMECDVVGVPLSLEEIKRQLSIGHPILFAFTSYNSDVGHLVVGFGINENNVLYVMDPSNGGSIKYYSYETYKLRCYANIVIKCINNIELKVSISKSNRAYIYEAAQSIEFRPNFSATVPFSAYTTGSTNCLSNCIAPSFQAIYKINDGNIYLHVRNGKTYAYELVMQDGRTIKRNGQLSFNDQEVLIEVNLPPQIFYFNYITITNECGSVRTLTSYPIPWY
ncbi:MAG: C39 family peptidase [Thermoplasmata archaeon]